MTHDSTFITEEDIAPAVTKKEKMTVLGAALGLSKTPEKIEFPADERESSTELGNGSPVEPSSVSEFKTTFRYSPTFGELIKALSAATLEFGEIVKDTENPYFRSAYADLATLIRATRNPLAKHGLCVVQSPQTNKGTVTLTTTLMHSSGEWLANDLELPVSKSDAQGNGSGITYARRYAYQSLLNLAGEEDDDGNAAVGKTQKDRASVSTESGPGRVNPVQMRAFQSACKSGKKTERQVIDYMGSLGHEGEEELLKSELNDAIAWAYGK